MSKWLFSAIMVAVVAGGAAHAACPAPPYTLTNGSTADATQIMANFNNVTTCFAPISAPVFTGNVSVLNNLAYLWTDSSGGNPNIVGQADNNWVFYNTNASGAQYPVLSQVMHAANPPLLVHVQIVGDASPISAGFVNSVSVGQKVAGSTLFYVNGTSGGTSAWQNTSDERLKKNIVQISDALGIVQRLRGVRFQWRSPSERSIGKEFRLDLDKPQLGFVAQEVESVAPEAVTRPKQPGAPYSMSADALVPVLVEAVKEQQAEIEQLRTQVAALKSGK